MLFLVYWPGLVLVYCVVIIFEFMFYERRMFLWGDKI